MTTRLTPVPSDSDCLSAWQQIADIARQHALVVSATGGVMTLALPEEQRHADIRDKVLRMHLMTEIEITSTPEPLDSSALNLEIFS